MIIIEFKFYYNYYNYITICNANRNKISKSEIKCFKILISDKFST